MRGSEDSVKAGFSKFVEEQQSVQTGKMLLDLAQFDSEAPFELLLESQPIANVKPLERFEPRGTTPLYDAISDMITHAEQTAKTEDVIMVVFTDGAENASRRASQKEVLERVEAKKKLGWTFVFLGANIDAYQAGGSLGYARGSTMTHGASAAGFAAAWSDVTNAMTYQRKQRAAPHYTAAMRVAASDMYFDAAGARTAEEKHG